MDLSVHCCFILLTGSFAPGILAQVTASPASVTVNPSTVKLGNDALMTFTFTPRESEGVKYVSWHKGVDSSIGDNVLVSTVDGDIGLTNGRYSFDSSNYLVISNATVEDAGSYLCSVVATSGETPQGFSTLTVHYLETPDLELKEKSFKAGETATFTCTSPNGVPTPITITWIKDGDVLDVSDTAKYSQSNTTLEIGRVNEMDEGDYQCRAENAAYSGDEGRLSNKGTLTVIHPPEYVDCIIVAPGENATTDEFTYQWITELSDTDTDPTTFTFKAPDDDVGTNYTVTMKATVKWGVDYCVFNPCGDKGTCRPIGLSANSDFKCECKQGYSGRYCENIVYACSSDTGLTIGMFFVGIIVGAFGVIGGLIGYTRIKQKASIDKRSTDQRLQDPYMDYVADNPTAGNEKQTYQDLLYREETAF